MPRSPNSSPDRFAEPALIADLAERFAAFRRTHPRFARIPRDLRAEAVAALGQGASPSQLCTACGVSGSQLALWRQASGGRAPSATVDLGARIFAVAEETPAPGATDPAPSATDALELRLGPWSVSVRLVAQQPAGRR